MHVVVVWSLSLILRTPGSLLFWAARASRACSRRFRQWAVSAALALAFFVALDGASLLARTDARGQLRHTHTVLRRVTVAEKDAESGTPKAVSRLAVYNGSLTGLAVSEAHGAGRRLPISLV